MIDRESTDGNKKCYMEIVRDRKAETLLRIIFDHVIPRSIVPFDAEFFLRNTVAIADPQNREVPIQIRKNLFSAVFGSRDIFMEFFFTFSIQFTMLILEFFTPTL
jgi:hypothetical protein